MNYRFTSFRINQREVTIAAVLSGEETSLTNFEKTTFEFIRQWLNGTDNFSQHTSGSTGTPKKIIISRSHMITSAQRTLQAIHITSADSALVCLNPEYIAGKMMLVRALEANLKIEAVEPSSDPLQSLPDSFQEGFAAFVPLQLQTMLEIPQRISQLNRMKAVLVGGASVSDGLHRKIKLLKCPVFATYGMTETVSNIALQKLNGPDPEDFFRVLPGITVKADERGCLVITLPEVSGPFITNDVAEVISDTTFRIRGRWDNVINTGGIKVWPESLELRAEKILQESGITRSFIFGGIPHEAKGEQLVLIVEGGRLSPEAENHLIAVFKKHFKPYEVPGQIRYLRHFVYTTTGKVNRPETLRCIG